MAIVKPTGEHIILQGVRCEVIKWRFDQKGQRWHTAYRFTVPGWAECTITGKRDTERVIRGRLDPATRNARGIQD